MTFWASAACTTGFSKPQPYHRDVRQVILIWALKSQHSRRKVLFSDISNSHHFYKDKYPWSRHSGSLTPGMISGSTNSPLQSTLQSTFTDNAEILKIPFSCFLLPNDTAPRQSTTFHEDSCFVTTGRLFIFSKLGSPECHSHFE